MLHAIDLRSSFIWGLKEREVTKNVPSYGLRSTEFLILNYLNYHYQSTLQPGGYIDIVIGTPHPLHNHIRSSS
jgi:hypothetical protein